ncbi:hypothetical protein FJ959_08730 [Mesorhizobium sp. B2-2-4]|uniref:hypothetical protein n=1 Tax=Mesorhizobium sp. B2-2-4 TaxID=2589962 RepID=UPI00112E907C|nr:hypothetical protein [Mesorhizobium sp. B2-2-4]TPM58951.1 hypothetical protein FJ959_08730 [Mesorhizobium sp. B2-2-4]
MTAALAYDPWGGHDLPANDNRVPRIGRPPLIGLTGKRNVGKSTVAALLHKEFGFVSVHPFASGKEASREWLIAAGFDADDAWEMIYGDLKDTPCDRMPGGVAPRYFMEKFGHFMGATLGVEWTLGMEIALVRQRKPQAPIVVESLVYEAPWFKAQGGTVWRLERPGHKGPFGVESDAVQAAVVADATISAATVEELERQARKIAQQMVGGW